MDIVKEIEEAKPTEATDKDNGAKLTDTERLNNRILETLNATKHTHVALIRLPSMTEAKALQSKMGRAGDLTVITDTTAVSDYTVEDLKFGDRLEDGKGGELRHAGTCVIVTTTKAVVQYAGVVLCSNRSFRNRINKLVGSGLVWEEVATGIQNLQAMNQAEADKRMAAAAASETQQV